MKVFRLLWVVPLLLLLWNGSAKPFMQDSNIAGQEAKAISIEQELDSLWTNHARLLNWAEIIAHRIELYRAKSHLNAREHRNLEKQLQESQQLENQVHAIESEIKSVNGDRYGILKTLAQLYQTEIDRLLQLTEDDQAPKKQESITKINQLLIKKQACEAQLVVQIPFTDSGLDIEAQPWDTPRQLQMKGNFLLDREDALRGEIGLVEERIRSLRDEKKIRAKVAELTHDLDLFDEREEILGRQSNTDAYATNLLSYWNETSTRATDAQKGWGSENWNPDITQPSLSQNVDLSNEGTFPRSPAYIQDTIERLESYLNRMVARADSLNAKALWFHREAEEKLK